ncbi:MAG TPA: hypothetical protein VN519_10530 [Bryobacteraceae bacterium]|nr:hypothetical protein [Bryobacteraceae bacterium]
MPRLIAAATLVLALLAGTPALAISVKDYNAKAIPERVKIAGDFVEKTTADIGRTNPQLMQAIRDWFAKGDGAQKVELELGALDLLAEKGKSRSLENSGRGRDR